MGLPLITISGEDLLPNETVIEGTISLLLVSSLGPGSVEDNAVPGKFIKLVRKSFVGFVSENGSFLTENGNPFKVVPNELILPNNSYYLASYTFEGNTRRENWYLLNSDTQLGQIIPIDPPPKQGNIDAISLFGETIVREAGENLSALRAVRHNSLNRMVYSDSLDLSQINKCVGITSTAANTGNNVTVVTFGPMEDASWNWDTSKPIFFDGNGNLVQTPSSTGFSQIIATPISGQKIWIRIIQALAL